MKKFIIGLIGIILMVIYVVLVIVTFAVTTISKLLIWVTNNAQNILEKVKTNFQYGDA